MAAFKHDGCPLTYEDLRDALIGGGALDSDGYCLQCKDLGNTTVRAAGHPRAQQGCQNYNFHPFDFIFLLLLLFLLIPNLKPNFSSFFLSIFVCCRLSYFNFSFRLTTPL